MVIKKVGEKRYVYLAFKRNKRTVHRYLGPLTDPKAAKAVRVFEEQKRVPERFAYLFWDTHIKSNFRDRYSLLKPQISFGDVPLAKVEDIPVMKVLTIVQRDAQMDLPCSRGLCSRIKPYVYLCGLMWRDGAFLICGIFRTNRLR